MLIEHFQFESHGEIVIININRISETVQESNIQFAQGDGSQVIPLSEDLVTLIDHNFIGRVFNGQSSQYVISYKDVAH